MNTRWFIVAALAVLAVAAMPLPDGMALPAPNDATSLLYGAGPHVVPDADGPTYTGEGAAKRPLGPEYYIVHLADEPLAIYDGSVAGLSATSPEFTGDAVLATDSDDSQAYLDYLSDRQDGFIAGASEALGRPLSATFHYRYAFNGVAVFLSPDEADRVATLPGVEFVERNTYEAIHTDAGPKWVGAEGIWDGSSTGGLPATKGEGMIVGIIDTGINLDHPSFATAGDDGYEHTNPKGEGNFVGWCDPDNENYNEELVCTEKLIGVYSFPGVGMDPEDDNGHGSHTASTTAGNHLDDATLYYPTVTIAVPISGVAPHANIIAYDACVGEGQGTCPSTATTAAIDQAVADGVNAINYSIGLGAESPWVNSRGKAFLGAAKAGVFVAASAGNSGPGAATTSANMPWVIAVAAASHDRTWANVLKNMTGGDTEPPADLMGAGATDKYGPAPIVHAMGYTNTGAEEDDGQCLQAFPEGTWDGEIVVCDRGAISRTQKGENVRLGGAGGFVLANMQAHGDQIAPDGYTLPGVHLTATDSELLRTWLATGEGHEAELSGYVHHFDPAIADIMAAFSSRGPTRSTTCCARPGTELSLPGWIDILKPEILAPGVSVLAAVLTPPGVEDGPAEFGMMGGTSMSSPHVAGAGTLMRALHPDWSIAQIKSALMTTAIYEGPLIQDGQTPAGVLDVGSGRMDVSRAAEAGLVLEITSDEFDQADPSLGGEPKALNLASMADTACLDVCGWERTVTSIADEAVTWTVTTEELDDLMLLAEPEEFVIEPGATMTVSVFADTLAMMYGDWGSGYVHLTPSDDSIPAVHMPISVQSVTAKVPQLTVIEASEKEGSYEIEGLEALDTEELSISSYGITKATIHEMSLEEDPTPEDPYDLTDPTGTDVTLLQAPEGSRRLVAEIPFSEAKDIDLYVGLDMNGDGMPSATEEICRSGSPSWYEMCNIYEPPQGPLWILVQNWKASDESPDDIVLAYGLVAAETDEGWTVTGPDMVERPVPFSLTIDWSVESMEPGDIYYGIVDLGTPLGAADLATMAIDIIGVREPKWDIFLPLTLREYVLIESTPTPEVTEEPTAEVTEGPTAEVTEGPTAEVTEEPTPGVTEEPTVEVTEEPTEAPVP